MQPSGIVQTTTAIRGVESGNCKNGSTMIVSNAQTDRATQSSKLSVPSDETSNPRDSGAS